MNRQLDLMKPSASMVLMTRAKEMQKTNPSVINLAGGEPDFPTPDRISMAAIRSLTEGNTHYAVGPGIPALRKAIAGKLREENGIYCDENCILVTPGGKNAIFLTALALLNPGDEVMFLTPAWVSYEPIILATGAVPVPVPLDPKTDYRITEEALDKAYTERTKMLWINYPNNPTGRILHEEEADLLEAFMKKHPDLYVLSDEMYEAIVYDGVKSASLGARKDVADHVITINGFSKSVAMTGWRLGYMACNKEVFQAAYKMYGHSISCVSGFIQEGAVEAFKCQYEIEEMRKVYEYRRNVFCDILNTIPGVKAVKPEGAFYAWVQYEIGGMTSEEIAEYLLEKAFVVGVPGTSFGEYQTVCTRFSFANATDEVETAALRIKDVLLKLQEK